MKLPRFLPVILLAAVIFFITGNGVLPVEDVKSEDFVLFTEAGPFIQPAEGIPGCPFSEITLQSYEVTINDSLFFPGNVSPGDRLLINLPGIMPYISEIDRVNTDINGTVSLRGKIDGDGSGYVVLSGSGERILATVKNYNEMKQYIVCYNSHSGSHVLYEIDTGKTGWLEDSPPLIPPQENKRKMYPASAPPEVEEDVTIDIMVVYTPAAREFAETISGINTFIAQAVELGQLALDNSETGVILRLVHSGEVNYTEKDSTEDLQRLTSTTGHMPEVHQWRDDYGADLVALFADWEHSGGQAWQLESISGQPTHGFSITRVQQSFWTYTMVHEFGHNLGLHHSKCQSVQKGPGIFGYSAGWRWAGEDNKKYASVMAYSESTYTIVPYFSNPDIDYKGVPTGHAADGDNARTLRQMKSVIAGYRPTTMLDSPVLIPDTGKTAYDNIRITFADKPSWRENVSSVYINEEEVEPGDFTLQEGSLVFKPRLLPGPGNYYIRVIADGYIAAAVMQSVVPNTVAEILSFEVDEEAVEAIINPEARTVRVFVQEGTDRGNLVPRFTLSGGAGAMMNGTPQISGETANDFSDTVIYTVIAENGSEADWAVTVREAVHIDSILFDDEKVMLEAGETTILSLSVTPPETDDDYLVWQSDNPSVVSVNESGDITALKKGIAVVTVTSYDGLPEDECIVTVVEEEWMKEFTYTGKIAPDSAVLEFPALDLKLSADAADAEGAVAVTRYGDSDFNLPPGLLPAGTYLNIELSRSLDDAGVIIELELSYDPDGLPEDVSESFLSLHGYDAGNERWEPVAGQLHDPLLRLIIADITGYSLLALLDPVLFGDVSLDGNINVSDAILVLRHIVGLEQLSPARQVRADVSGSGGSLNVTDAILILRRIVGLISFFPIEAETA